MPFITTPERIGREEGLKEGLLQGIRSCLKVKFPGQWEPLFDEVSRLEDVALLQTVLGAVEAAATPDEVRRAWSR